MNDSLVARMKRFVSTHKKALLYWLLGIAGLVAVLAVSLYYLAGFIVTPNAERADSVASFMHDFEESLPLVPLDKPAEEVARAMDTHYAAFLSGDLLASWKANPALALGDPAGDPIHTSIRVKSVKQVGVLAYVVKAYVIEEVPVTLPGLGSGMAKRDIPVTFGVAWRGLSWKIVEFSFGHGDDSAPAATTPS